jgi:hypothetical protein
VAVPALAAHQQPHDLDPLRLHPQVELRFVGPGTAAAGGRSGDPPRQQEHPRRSGLAAAQGWEAPLARHLRYGGKVIGPVRRVSRCWAALHDPLGVDGQAGSTAGLGWLDLETTFGGEKHLSRVSGRLAFAEAPVTGYEIHMGETRGPALERPAVHLEDRDDGALSADGQILGSYLHGLFEAPAACAALLEWAGLGGAAPLDYGRPPRGQPRPASPTRSRRTTISIRSSLRDLGGRRLLASAWKVPALVQSLRSSERSGAPAVPVDGHHRRLHPPRSCRWSRRRRHALDESPRSKGVGVLGVGLEHATPV